MREEGARSILVNVVDGNELFPLNCCVSAIERLKYSIVNAMNLFCRKKDYTDES